MVTSVYLLPLCEPESNLCWIEKIRAKSFKDAEEKYMDDFVDTYDIKEPLNWKQCKEFMSKQAQIIVGDISDIEEY